MYKARIKVCNIMFTPTTLEHKNYHALEGISAFNLNCVLMNICFLLIMLAMESAFQKFYKSLTEDWGRVRGRPLEILSRQENFQINWKFSKKNQESSRQSKKFLKYPESFQKSRKYSRWTQFGEFPKKIEMFHTLQKFSRQSGKFSDHLEIFQT